jgi:hypothetical protein
MKRARLLIVITLITTLSLTFSSFNHYSHVEAATDSVLQELNPDETTTLNQPILSSAEEFSYVSGVDTWEYGYIDGKYYGQSGFSLSNLQDDGNYATLEEAADPWTGRFVYSFDIDISIRTSYLSMAVEARGYCYSEKESLKFEWSNDGGASWTNLFSITSTSIALKSQNINTNKDSILVRAIDTSTTFGDPISSWKVDFIRVRFFDPPNSNAGLSLDILHDTDNLYPYYGKATSQYYIFEGTASDDDLVCYFVVCLDGRGVYENMTHQVKVPMKHPINISLTTSDLTFSDQALLDIEVSSLHDSTYSGDLQSELHVYSSDDNATWSLIGANTTSTSGRAHVNWTCDIGAEVFFKIAFGGNSHFTHGTEYFQVEVAKENTLLEIARVGKFTYSDQGTILVRLTTDDDEPLSGYSLYIELKDETWISIGSGLTNSSGYASILWIPHLPAGVYSIQVRASMIESVCYQPPISVSATVDVAKEIVLLTVDTSAMNQGFISALVTDDEHEPIEGLRVDLYDDEDATKSSVLSDSEGYASFNLTPKNGERFRIVVHSNEYYGGNEERIRIHISTDLNLVIFALASVALVIGSVSVIRKIWSHREVEVPAPPQAELQRALEEERERIPIRVQEQREERKAKLKEEIAITDKPKQESAKTAK